jgi:hypothetical protein
MKVHRTALMLVAGLAFAPVADAKPTLQSLSRQVAALSRHVKRDDAEIARLRSQKPRFTIRHAISLGNDIGQARCLPGETVLGGGAGWTPKGAQSSTTPDYLRYSMPFTDSIGSGWKASGVEPFGREFQPFTIFAVCAGSGVVAQQLR